MKVFFALIWCGLCFCLIAPNRVHAQEKAEVRLEPAPLQSMDSLRASQLATETARICKSEQIRDLVKFHEQMQVILAGRGSKIDVETVAGQLPGKPFADKLKEWQAKEKDLRIDIERAARDFENDRVKALAKTISGNLQIFQKRGPDNTTEACEDPCKEDIVRQCLAPEAERGPSRSGMLGPAALLGGGWESALIQGVASFVSERADAEVVQWFAAEFQQKLCETADSSALFEETCSLLPKLKTGTQVAPSSLLASAIRADLEVLPIRIAGPRLGLSPEDVRLLGQLFIKARQGESPLSLLAGIAKDARLGSLCSQAASAQNASCALYRVGQIVSLLGDAAQLTPSKFDAELPRILDAYADLLASSATLCIPPKPGDKDATVERTAQLFCSLVDLKIPREEMGELLRLANALRAAQATSSANDGPLSKAATVLSLTVRLVRATVRATKAKGWSEILDAMEAASEMSLGHYADGLRRIVVLIDRCADEPEDTPAVAPGTPEPPKKHCLDPKLLRYAGLIVDLAAARTADDVRKALDAAAAPVGSWRSKRVNVVASLGAIVGISGGLEVPLDTTRGVTGGAGAMIPIGIDFSGPIGRGWTFGAFLSVIDVGQLATFSIGGASGSGPAETESVGTLEIVQVLSPGIYPHFGLGESPFYLGVGASVAPRLREEDDSEDPNKATILRINAFFGVDVTIFPF